MTPIKTLLNKHPARVYRRRQSEIQMASAALLSPSNSRSRICLEQTTPVVIKLALINHARSLIAHYRTYLPHRAVFSAAVVSPSRFTLAQFRGPSGGSPFSPSLRRVEIRGASLVQTANSFVAISAINLGRETQRFFHKLIKHGAGIQRSQAEI